MGQDTGQETGSRHCYRSPSCATFDLPWKWEANTSVQSIPRLKGKKRYVVEAAGGHVDLIPIMVVETVSIFGVGVLS